MATVREFLDRGEELLVALQHNAWQQREALIALRVGAVEALAAQQEILLRQLELWQQQGAELFEQIQKQEELRQRWERLRLQAQEVRRLLQLNRLLAQRAQQHTLELLTALLPDGHVYNRQA
jgi:flagellar biosynthesis/type III secretory pathway chaperone